MKETAGSPISIDEQTIKFPCPNCGQTLYAPANLAGQNATCKACRDVLVVPQRNSIPPPIRKSTQKSDDEVTHARPNVTPSTKHNTVSSISGPTEYWFALVMGCLIIVLGVLGVILGAFMLLSSISNILLSDEIASMIGGYFGLVTSISTIIASLCMILFGQAIIMLREITLNTRQAALNTEQTEKAKIPAN